jgi:hypothetical protein
VVESTPKDVSDVATPASEKGNLDSNPNINDSVSVRKLGLEDLNEAIETTKNMNVDKDEKEPDAEKSVDNADIETLGLEKVVPDVGTSLVQPSHPENSVEKSVGNVSQDGTGQDDTGVVSGEKENEKTVVDVDDLDDVPLAQKVGEDVAKRLRSNKGKSVDVAEKPTGKGRTPVVGPKKSWSKVVVKSSAGSSRKRKNVSSSESEYEAEEDVQDIVIASTKRERVGRSWCLWKRYQLTKSHFIFLVLLKDGSLSITGG